jgi:KDO2-lipid IV(A) lauroyltransferase
MRRCVGEDLPQAEFDELVRRAFQSYARYWVESFRLPTLPTSVVDASVSYEGVEHLLAARETGTGAMVVCPHSGGWEWAAYFLSSVLGMPVTAVVEPVEPPELFEFFRTFRAELGMHVVPLGAGAGTAVIKALAAGHIIPLLADRDIEGNGVEVEFFGERTTLPAGPATIALRTGAPLCPGAMYFSGDGHRPVIRPPLPVERQGRLRDDVTRITQALAHELEDLIRAAPDQWHLQQPNWPSDDEALEALRRRRPRPGATAASR